MQAAMIKMRQEKPDVTCEVSTHRKALHARFFLLHFVSPCNRRETYV